MVTTKRLLLPLYLFVAVVATAACRGDTPTSHDGQIPTEARRSGIGFGSGNVVPNDSTDAQSTTAQDDAPAESDSTAAPRGIGFGSGN